MKRLAINLLGVLSVVACLAVAWLWAGSYLSNHTVGYLSYPPASTLREGDTWSAWGMVATSSSGGVGFRWSYATPTDPGDIRNITVTPNGWYYFNRATGGSHRGGAGGRGWEGFGFGWSTGSYFGYDDSLAVWVPYWFLLTLAAVPPLAWWRSLRRRRNRRSREVQGRCASCEYDLRGSAGPCPECGNAAPDVS